MLAAPCEVLVVEDNPEIRQVLRMGLELEGFSVREASDGQDGLEALAREPLPNVILLDLLMPRMNGYELLEKIKEDPGKPLASIPVVILSAVAPSAVARHRIEQTQEILAKPVDFDKLIETVKRYCPRQGA